MSTITTVPTITGWKLFAEKGVVPTLYGVDFKDDSYNYAATVPESNIALVNGTSTTTTAFCGIANGGNMYQNPLTPEEIKQLTSRLKINFNNINCATGEWSDPSPHFIIDLGTLADTLYNITSYSNTGMPSLTNVIYDYISGIIQTRDNVSNTFVNKNSITNFDKIIYNFNSSEDLLNYNKVSPFYVSSQGSGIQMVDNTSSVRWSLPTSLFFSTASVNGGSFVNGTSAVLQVRFDEWGYWTDKGFQSISTVENNQGAYTEIYPAGRIGSNYFYKNVTTTYPTQTSGYIGEIFNMVNVNDSEERATKALADQIILGAKSNFTLGLDGIYRNIVNVTVNFVDSRVNNITTIGNNVTFEFIYNPLVSGSDIISH